MTTLKNRLDKLEKLQIAGDPNKAIKIFEFRDGMIFDFKTKQEYTEQEYLDYRDQHPEEVFINVTYKQEPYPDWSKE